VVLDVQEGAGAEDELEEALAEAEGRETLSEAAPGATGPISEEAVMEAAAAFLLGEEDRVRPAAEDAEAMGADALEEQLGLAPPPPSPMRPTFGSFAPLVPSEPLSGTPRSETEPAEAATAVADEWSESTATPPEELPGAAVAESTESAVQSAEEVVTETAPEVAPAPRRRTRSTSRGRRGATPTGETSNGSAGGETPT
jgi:hypothetical protein